MIKILKKQALAISGIALVAAPLAAVACGTETAAATNLTRGGVYSSFYNATDMLTALGYYPDAVSVSSDQTLYSDSLKPVLGEQNKFGAVGEVVNTGKLSIVAGPRVMDGQQVNSEQLAALELKSILLNEWFKADAPKLAGVAPNLLYTTMADASGREAASTVYGLKTWRMNVMDCFKMLVDDLARAYPSNASTIIDRYNAFKAATEARYAAFNAASDQLGAAALRGKSIAVFHASVTSTAQEALFQELRSDTIYEPLYSVDVKRGLGMVFPRPAGAPATGNLTSLSAYGLNDFGVTNGSGDFSIKAKDSATLLSSYANTSDYVVVLKNPQAVWPANFDELAKSAAKSVQKAGDATKVLVVNSDLWYDTIWGPRGVNTLLDELNDTFKVNAQLPALPSYEALAPLR